MFSDTEMAHHWLLHAKSCFLSWAMRHFCVIKNTALSL
ncbi:hypothetical protein ECDEC11B_1546 [Escherichia coli DEC11B]|nr:hypothetical protein ECDEC11B_1546 [Escherichia coli DEC11B]